jgi:hypothetical protein
MESRNYITFKASFPDDAEWSQKGTPLVPGGRAIARSLVARLESRGFRCSELEQHSFYGWSFNVDHAGANVWCLLQYAEPWLLLTECRTTIAGRLLHPGQREKQADVVEALNLAMQGDSRFSGIRLWTKTEFESRRANDRNCRGPANPNNRRDGERFPAE